jgi:hypothetical protein
VQRERKEIRNIPRLKKICKPILRFPRTVQAKNRFKYRIYIAIQYLSNVIGYYYIAVCYLYKLFFIIYSAFGYTVLTGSQTACAHTQTSAHAVNYSSKCQTVRTN